MADTGPRPWQKRAATPQEIESCLAAIERAHPGALDPSGPSEVYAVGSGGEASFYVNPKARDAMPVGTVYRTWVVTLDADGEAAVSWFRSRRGERGDDSLPPDGGEEETLPP